MKKLLTAIFLTSAFITPLFAQGPGGRRDPASMVQRRVNFLTTLLSLTNNQQTEATTILTNAAASAAAVRTSLRTARQTLADAVTRNDTATIDQASTAIGNLTGQLTSTEAKSDAAFFQMLTPDQQTKFTQLKSQRGPMRPPIR
jgi:Spy/CpxP family protein refolding chaperone